MRPKRICPLRRTYYFNRKTAVNTNGEVFKFRLPFCELSILAYCGIIFRLLLTNNDGQKRERTGVVNSFAELLVFEQRGKILLGEKPA